MNSISLHSTSLYSSTLAVLVATRDAMLTDEWMDMVSHADPTTKEAAFEASFRISHAIVVLSNQILSDIADKMDAQKDALTSAINDLNASIAKIAAVAGVLDSIAKLLDVVGKIVSLV